MQPHVGVVVDWRYADILANKHRLGLRVQLLPLGRIRLKGRFFHQRVKRGLLELGLTEQNVRLAWLDWQEPDATEALRHLAAFGCEKIIVVPASMPLDSTSTLVDIGQAVGLARLPAEIELVRLPAWGDHPAVADALAADVIETAAESKGTDVGERP